MARIQQSIEINVPVHAAYSKLMQFEEYPRFMQDVEAVQQVDDRHLHWSARLAGRSMEWDSEITEQLDSRRIAWRNLNGPQNAGMVELREIGEEKANVTLTMECDPVQMLASHDGNAEGELTQRMGEDLARFKKLVETRDSESGTLRLSDAGQQQAAMQDESTTQSDASLSRSFAGQAQDQFSVAEEQNFDAQSDQARRVGHMPQGESGAGISDTVAQAMQLAEPDAKAQAEMGKALERAVPPSEEPTEPERSGNSGNQGKAQR